MTSLRPLTGGELITARNPRSVDALVIGQGLAGTAVAWELYRRGKSFLIIDSADHSAASRVAAGLITPVAGKRFAVAEHFCELHELASACYRELEKRLQASFYYGQPALRLCYSDEEVELFERHAAELIESGFIRVSAEVDNNVYGSVRRALLMPHAARLNTQVYLDGSRRFFDEQHRLINGHLASDTLEITGDRIVCDALKLNAQHVIFCGGYHDQHNPWLPSGVFNCAKGEILEVQIDGFHESRTVHARKSWLCPTDRPDTYLFGATYDHEDVDDNVTLAARRELESRLASIVNGPFTVLGQRAGVRPVGLQRSAIVGRSKQATNIAWLNGLGSKGVLLAPYLASILVGSLIEQRPVSVSLTAAHVHG